MIYRYLKSLTCIILLSIFINVAEANTSDLASKSNVLLPGKLKSGDTVGLISSASRAPSDDAIQFAEERLQSLGLKVVIGKYVYAREGYFAGTDEERAADLNHMFADPKIKAIFEVRGGFGSDRILPLINYTAIKQNPKIIIGFSDITSLLLAINKKTGLITFHGPMGIEKWPQFSVDSMKKVIFNGEKVVFHNPTDEFDPAKDIIQTKDRIQVINKGSATGELIGGNLSVLVTLLGTPYEPNWKGKILFIEDVHEQNYQIDRALAQLQLAGVFKQIKGLIFGKCTACTMGDGTGGFTLNEILSHYVKPAGIPAFMGSMIGHQATMFTLPEGIPVRMDADSGTIAMLAPAVRRST